MAMTPSETVTELAFIKKAVEGALKEKVEKLYEEKKKEIMDRLDREKAETVAGILVDMMKMTEMSILQDRVVFTIRTK